MKSPKNSSKMSAKAGRNPDAAAAARAAAGLLERRLAEAVVGRALLRVLQDS